jgi:hypothetical protein
MGTKFIELGNKKQTRVRFWGADALRVIEELGYRAFHLGKT